jgi:thymidylate kinase
LLAEFLEKQNYKVLQTKEPGTSLLPLTIELRGLMLDAQYESALTVTSRELISQTIRSIHMEKLIFPAMNEYDFIIQDRGVLSGLSYGWTCGNNIEWLKDMALRVTKADKLYDIYSDVIILEGNIAGGLLRAREAKQEFKAGDAMEGRGLLFMKDVAARMSLLSTSFPVKTINIDGSDIEQVQNTIRETLHLF